MQDKQSHVLLNRMLDVNCFKMSKHGVAVNLKLSWMHVRSYMYPLSIFNPTLDRGILEESDYD